MTNAKDLLGKSLPSQYTTGVDTRSLETDPATTTGDDLFEPPSPTSSRRGARSWSWRSFLSEMATTNQNPAAILKRVARTARSKREVSGKGVVRPKPGQGSSESPGATRKSGITRDVSHLGDYRSGGRSTDSAEEERSKRWDFAKIVLQHTQPDESESLIRLESSMEKIRSQTGHAAISESWVVFEVHLQKVLADMGRTHRSVGDDLTAQESQQYDLQDRITESLDTAIGLLDFLPMERDYQYPRKMLLNAINETLRFRDTEDAKRLLTELDSTQNNVRAILTAQSERPSTTENLGTSGGGNSQGRDYPYDDDDDYTGHIEDNLNEEGNWRDRQEAKMFDPDYPRNDRHFF